MNAKHALQLTALVLAGALLAGCTQGTAQNNEALENQVAQLSSQLSGLQGQLEQSNAQMDALQTQLAEIATATAGGNGGGGAIRIGFVNAEEVFVKYRGTEDAIQAYRVEKDQREKELNDLQDRYSAGAISQNEFLTRQQELQQTLAALDQQLTNDITQKIVEAVESIGSELGFDLITTRKNVVLYYRENGIVDDLTEQVLAFMNDALDTTP